jgi:predicted unusual protein kinase regulating ubiquinone biosynthesis (AarF/ABC1/UbiB family)
LIYILYYYFLFYFINHDYNALILHVTRKLVNKNVLYVKLFQAICLNVHLIDDTIHREIIKYTDSVPYSSDDIDWETISYLERWYNLSLIETDHFLPINSGMISIVFKMQHNETGEIFIIKLKRKDIDIKLIDSLNEFKFIIYLLSFIPFIRNLDISTVMSKNIDILKEQLDFGKEVNNMIESREMMSHLDYVRIPKVFEEVTRSNYRVIMQEYIVGTHVADLNDEDYDSFAELILKYGVVSVMKGITHGDLHPGNILFIKNELKEGLPKYQIGLIDFGVVIRMGEQSKHILFETIPSFFTTPSIELSKKVLDIVLEPRDSLLRLPKAYLNEMYGELGDIIDLVIKNNEVKGSQAILYDFMIGLNQFINKRDFKKYGIHISDDFCKIQMALAMSHDVSIKLCRGDYLTLCNNVLNQLFHLDLLND